MKIKSGLSGNAPLADVQLRQLKYLLRVQKADIGFLAVFGIHEPNANYSPTVGIFMSAKRLRGEVLKSLGFKNAVRNTELDFDNLTRSNCASMIKAHLSKRGNAEFSPRALELFVETEKKSYDLERIRKELERIDEQFSANEGDAWNGWSTPDGQLELHRLASKLETGPPT